MTPEEHLDRFLADVFAFLGVVTKQDETAYFEDVRSFF